MPLHGAPPLPVLATLLLVAATHCTIQLVHQAAGGTFDVVEVEVPLGHYAPGGTTGSNDTVGAVSLAGSLIGASTNLFYLNNTNTTGAYYAKITATGTAGLAEIVTPSIRIDNGTGPVDQVLVSLGALMQSAGAYVRLEPSSTNIISVTQTVTALHATSTVDMDIRVADDETEAAYVVMTAVLTLTWRNH